ncbi:hypothetical protein [Flavobacterium sp. DSR2-3-3]|uniref:hypothetical protein n=1 Tax=Flavobacterium sp. DSR2-3-3 TaxID=2804632 RepID=UPI003CE88148
MRLTVFFLYLFFYLQCGGNYVHATSHDNDIYSSLISKLVHSDEVKFAKTISGSIMINAGGFDLEEECSNSDSLKKRNLNKNVTEKFGVSKVWYQTFSCQSVLNYCNKNFKIFAPFCGQSYPIYIIQQVLRI